MPITPQEALQRTIEHREIFHDEMVELMRQMMRGEVSPAMTAAILTGLRVKKETVGEIAGAASVLREFARPVEVADRTHLVDIVGTGGDGAHTFNISTASAFVTAAAGGRVAKHGNRSVSSSCGSADVLEAAGVNLELTPEQVARCVDELGVGFLFAPKHHSAMRHAIGPRREMGVRTLFNLLGPLTNPAGAPNQVLGVFGADWVRPLAEVLNQLGSRHVLVVHAYDGLDEISIGSPTLVAELKDGQVHDYQISPEQFGMQRVEVSVLAVKDAEQSLAVIQGVFAGEPGPARDIVALNAGAAIYVAGLADNLETGVAKALEVLDNGAARQKLDALVQLSQAMASA